MIVWRQPKAWPGALLCFRPTDGKLGTFFLCSDHFVYKWLWGSITVSSMSTWLSFYQMSTGQVDIQSSRLLFLNGLIYSNPRTNVRIHPQPHEVYFLRRRNWEQTSFHKTKFVCTKFSIDEANDRKTKWRDVDGLEISRGNVWEGGVMQPLTTWLAINYLVSWAQIERGWSKWPDDKMMVVQGNVWEGGVIITLWCHLDSPCF